MLQTFSKIEKGKEPISCWLGGRGANAHFSGEDKSPVNLAEIYCPIEKAPLKETKLPLLFHAIETN